MAQGQVIVVGGGVSGLAAAASLRARGVDACVLEAAPRLGGRPLGSGARNADGDAIDATPQLVGAADAHLRDVLALAGLAEPGRPLPLRPCRWAQVVDGAPRMVDRTGGLVAWHPPGLPWIERRRLRRLPRLLRRFDTLLDPAAPEGAARLDDRSVSEMARLYVGPHCARHFAGPAVSARELADPAAASRVVWMLDLARRWGRARGTLRVHTGALAAALAHPSDRTGCRVERVEPAAGGGVMVHVCVGDATGSLEADAVILATPPAVSLAVAEALLSTAQRAFLASARFVPSLTGAFRLAEAPVPATTWVAVPGDEDDALASLCIEPPGPASRADGDSALAFAVVRPAQAARWLDADDARIQDELSERLAALYPRARGALQSVSVHRFEAALPSFPVGRFRALARFRQVEGDRLAHGSRVLFAGDALAGAHLEGAAASGLRAADAAAALLGAARGTGAAAVAVAQSR